MDEGSVTCMSKEAAGKLIFAILKVSMKAKKREGEHKDGKEVKYLIQIMWNDHNERLIPRKTLHMFLEMKGLCSGFDSLYCACWCVIQYWSKHFERLISRCDAGTCHCLSPWTYTSLEWHTFNEQNCPSHLPCPSFTVGQRTAFHLHPLHSHPAFR